MRHWKEVGPPVYMAVAAYLGLGTELKEKGPQAKPSSKVGDDPAKLLAQFPGGMIH